MPIPTPSSDEEKINAIRLYRSPRIGSKNYFAVMEKCASFEEGFELVCARAKDTGQHDYALASTDAAMQEYEAGMHFDATFLASGDAQYPRLLEQAEDRPPFLWAKGRLELFEAANIAIIGSRNPTLEGVRMAAHLSKLLAYEGVVITSGLARGIDAAAHEAAVTLGTIGVVAGGIDVFYPKSNAELQNVMLEHGIVVSEMPFGFQPRAQDFPKRNRIIAGLALGVLVVEATARSGTRLTVNDAQRLDRAILAVPGHPFSGLSALPNQLIVEGAGLVRDISDVYEILPALRAEDENPAPPIEPPMGLEEMNGQDDPSAAGRALIEGRAVQDLDGTVRKLHD